MSGVHDDHNHDWESCPACVAHAKEQGILGPDASPFAGLAFHAQMIADGLSLYTMERNESAKTYLAQIYVRSEKEARAEADNNALTHDKLCEVLLYRGTGKDSAPIYVVTGSGRVTVNG